MMRTLKNRLNRLILITVAGWMLHSGRASGQSDAAKPQPARNDVAQPGEEMLILRHQKLVKGSHHAFYTASRAGVWPWFEKIGTRIVGQWQVIHPDGEGGSDEYDEGYRLARYRSYEHWLDTRQGRNLGGNGPDFRRSRAALAERRQFLLGSDVVYFLQGHMAPGGPFYMPGVEENYERTGMDETYERLGATGPSEEASRPRPVRNSSAAPGHEIVTMRYWKIKKGSFDEFYMASLEGVWPYFEKIGARVIGQWKVIYPEASDRKENPGFDEVIMLTRYAGYEHWAATRRPAQLGGNGPDYDKLLEALAFRRTLSQETTLTFLEGYMYHSPPVFLPGLRERYRTID